MFGPFYRLFGGRKLQVCCFLPIPVPSIHIQYEYPLNLKGRHIAINSTIQNLTFILKRNGNGEDGCEEQKMKMIERKPCSLEADGPPESDEAITDGINTKKEPLL